MSLPDEAMASRVYVHPERRQHVLHELTDVRLTVTQYLEACFANATQKNDVKMQEKILQCFYGWLRDDIMVARELVQSPLLTAPFATLNSLFDVSKDVICELLRSSQDVQRDTEVVQILVPRVMALAPAYDQATAAQDEGNNEEVVRGLCYIFSELGENYLTLLCEGSPDALQFVQLLCKCTANEDPEVSRRTFEFWYRLRKAIIDADNWYGRSQDQTRALQVTFTPYFSAVCDSVIKLLKWNDDYADETAEEQEDFRRLRLDVADVLQDCCDVIGGDACLLRIYTSLQVAAQDMSNWQGIEACFYAIRRIHRTVSPQEEAVLPYLLPMLPQLPNHEQLNYTATLVVGAYADWVESHPNVMGDLFTFVISRLGDAKVMPAACLSIKNLCDACRKRMVGSMGDLITVYKGNRNPLNPNPMLEPH